MDHEYWAYIIASLSGTRYFGVTNNIERRMREHKSGELEGFAAKYKLQSTCILRKIRRYPTVRSNSKAGEGRKRLC